MKVEIMTKNQVKKFIAEEIEKKEKLIFGRLDQMQHRIYQLEEELKAKTGPIKLPGKNHK